MSFITISNIILFLLLESSTAFSQKSSLHHSDSEINILWQDIQNKKEIEKELAIKYLNIPSSELTADNVFIESDSSFQIGSHYFAIISYAVPVNCEYMRLIEYKKDSGVFLNRLLIARSCDFDPSGDHTTQIEFKFKERKLYVYKNYYKIRDEDLVLDKKGSQYKIYNLPNLTLIFYKKAEY